MSAREVTELRFAVQPGLQVRAHVDYRLVAGVFTAAKREGRTARVYVIDGAGMLSAASLERQLAECGADVHIALSSIDMCRATALDGMLVCLQRVSALIRARPNLYALVLVYGLSQLVPAHRTATNVQEFVNCVMQLGVLSREGNVAVVSCNACFELPQGFVYAGLAPRRGTAARAVPRHGSAVNAGGINRRELDRISPLTVGLPTAATCDAAALAPVAGRRRATSLPATSRGAAGTWATHTFCALRSAGTPATRPTP